MNYDPDDFLDLEYAVEATGGIALPDLCEGYWIKYPASRGRAHKRVRSSHCGNHSKFSVPYIGEGGKAGHVIACAVDDDMGAWPRFQA